MRRRRPLRSRQQSVATQTQCDAAGRPIEIGVGSRLDVTERVQAQQALATSEQRLRDVIDAVFGFVGLFTLDGVVIDLNRAPLEAGGLKKEDIVGKPFTDTYWWSHSATERDQLRAAMRRAAAGEVVRYEAQPQMAGGTRVFVDSTFAPLHDAQGEIVNIVGFGMDITERKRAEEVVRAALREKEILLREIHHRIKNSLQLIASLLYFQAQKATEPAAAAVFADARDRLRSLILVHEKLYRSSSLSHVDFGDYVHSLVGQLRETYGAGAGRIQVCVDVEPVQLPIETALPGGMIVCELFTNAFKYAFPGERCGRITVSVRAAAGRVTLTVSDDGVGLPAGFDAQRTESFGWQLVRNLTAQVDGRVDIAPSPGTHVTISLPLPPERV